MKNILKAFGIIAIVAVIGFSFAGCNTGEGEDSPEPAAPQKMVYTWDAGDDSYELEITEASEGRAVYTPKTGDTYVLTITLNIGGTKKSSGTVAVSSSSGSGKESTLTLKPANSNTPFTVTVVATANNVLVESVDGEIVLEGGEKVTVSGPVTPVKEYQKFELKAARWTYQGWVGESWVNYINLFDFTAHIPQKGDKLTFKLRGTTDKPLQEFQLMINCNNGDGYEIQILGTAQAELSGTFNKTFTIEIENGEQLKYDHFNLTIENFEDIPEDAINGQTTMATISNFRISLVKIESAY